jgi:predicted transcriptional regulator
VSVTAAEPIALATDLRPLLLSLRPRFAEAILDRSKTVELRRTRIAAPAGTQLILYASAPIMAVVGVATLTGRDTDTPARIWRRHRRNLGLSRAEFDQYIEGADLATAVVVDNATRLQDVHTLAYLRSQTGFHPPQSFRYLSSKDPEVLHNLITSVN